MRRGATCVNVSHDAHGRSVEVTAQHAELDDEQTLVYAAAQRMARLLLEKHQVLTVARRGLDQGAVVRVTPTLYNTTAELDRFVRALRAESGAFL